MSFIDFARAHGVEIDPSRLYPSDKIMRCGTVDKPRSGNGAYFWDGQRGWCFDWSGEAKTIWYNDPTAKPWTEEEMRAWAQKRASAASEQDKKYRETAREAQEELKRAKLECHPYLEYKGLHDERGFVLNDKLLVPMRNVSTNRIQGYQSIFWNQEERKYAKLMKYGMRAKNAVLFLGNRDFPEYWLVEGFATGLSLRQALRSIGIMATVVVCFSAGNMVQVSDQLRGNRYVFADNDESKTGERAAIETGLPWTMADQTGWDVNDLHQKNGLFSVVKKVMDLKFKT